MLPSSSFFLREHFTPGYARVLPSMYGFGYTLLLLLFLDNGILFLGDIVSSLVRTVRPIRVSRHLPFFLFLPFFFLGHPVCDVSL